MPIAIPPSYTTEDLPSILIRCSGHQPSTRRAQARLVPIRTFTTGCYGWGYRKWGPPYPRYIQRRRGARATTVGETGVLSHQAWGWRGDFVWAVVFVGLLWAVVTLCWR